VLIARRQSEQDMKDLRRDLGRFIGLPLCHEGTISHRVIQRCDIVTLMMIENSTDRRPKWTSANCPVAGRDVISAVCDRHHAQSEA